MAAEQLQQLVLETIDWTTPTLPPFGKTKDIRLSKQTRYASPEYYGAWGYLKKEMR